MNPYLLKNHSPWGTIYAHSLINDRFLIDRVVLILLSFSTLSTYIHMKILDHDDDDDDDDGTCDECFTS
jgi:hypothetical protein